MNRIVVKSKVSSDGVLHLSLPVGLEKAETEVLVTVEPKLPSPISQEEWREFVKRTAGSISDKGFRRWEQGEFESREPLK